MDAATTEELRSALAPVRERPEAAAVATDIDGTIAPIAPRAEEARVPERSRELLRRIAARYALVACLSGRRAEDARRLVGLEEIAYSGNHGLELLSPSASEPRPHPLLAGHEHDAAALVEGLDEAELERLGIRVEDKGAIVALHWRGSPDEPGAEERVGSLAAEAERRGLLPHRGRKVLEIRPPVEVDKGVAIIALLEGEPIEAALYAGDDRTDVDAFRALEEMVVSGRLRGAVRVAILSEEGPPEIAAAASLSVRGPEGFVTVLEALAA